MLKKPVFSRVFRPVQNPQNLFPLNGADGLGSEIEQHAVDAVDFMGDAVGDMVQQRIGDRFDRGGHRVGGVHGADDGRPALVALVIAHADGLEI